MTQDPIVALARDLLLSRSELGIAKYGVTLDRKDLSLADWLQHACEEALDGALYLIRARQDVLAAASVPAVNHKNDPPTVSSERPQYSTDMARYPLGAKAILLTRGGTAVLGSATSTEGYVAWAPLPKLTAAQKAELKQGGTP